MTTATPPLLEVTGLTKHYPGVRALDGVDLVVLPGQVHCLLGQNGAGKSTLIKCVSGAVEPTEGEVRVLGRPLPVGDPAESAARGVGTIYQELDLVDDLTVAANVYLGHEPKRRGLLDRKRMERDTRALLERLDHPHIDPGTRVGELMPASQQVVAIARALSRDVRLLIMDEPSAILDDREVDVLFGVVRRLVADGVGVIYISHRLDEVNRIGDIVTVLKDGRTVARDLPPTTPADDIVAHMVGGRPEALYPDRLPGGGDVLLEVRDLSRAGGPGALPLHDVSFTLHAGEVLGIAGLVGSGRTEILRAVYGLDRPDRGTVAVRGAALPPGDVTARLEAGMGLAPEERKSAGLLLDWSLTRNTTIADLKRFRRGGRLDLRAERAAATEHLTAVGTRPADPDRLARQLSGGNQQKVVLARWLLRSCDVLLLDEPTRGVDVGARGEIYRLIADLAAEGRGVVVVSSELPELLGLCTRILVLRDGRLVAEHTGGEVDEQTLVAACVAPLPEHDTREVA
jgi:ribose transport system ATP-binding protein